MRTSLNIDPGSQIVYHFFGQRNLRKKARKLENFPEKSSDRGIVLIVTYGSDRDYNARLAR
jgi:hypothetical protein